MGSSGTPQELTVSASPDRLKRSYAARFAQLAALWSLSVSQPVFSMLGENPEFLVVRRSTHTEIAVFAVGLAFLPPMLVVLGEWGVGRVSLVAEDRLHRVAIGLFALPIVMIALKASVDSTAVVMGIAVAVAVSVAYLYARSHHLRLFLTLGVLLPVLGVGTFLLYVDVATENAYAAQVPVSREVPIVMVVFDELPTSALMTRSGEIDDERFPNFARLARSATWFPRATTVHEHTTGALPAILTGRLPKSGQVPSLTDHPENLFTLLGESYDLRVHEEVTYLCPKRYCPRPQASLRERVSGLAGDIRIAYLHLVLPHDLSARLPRIDHRWSGFQNTERLLEAESKKDVDVMIRNRSRAIAEPVSRFLGGITADEPAKTLHFLHLQLPHLPWRFMPSGRDYGDGEVVDGLGSNGFWSNEEWLVVQAYQRLLMQVGYTDTVLGRILDRLEDKGILDEALVVVAADHGVSIRAGRERRAITRANFPDIARVPLFVKLPGQRIGSVDQRPVSTIALLPTVANVVGVRLPWRVDGSSLRRAAAPSVSAVFSREHEPVRMSASAVDRLQQSVLDWKSRHFGAGGGSVFAIGNHRGLIGRPTSSLSAASSERTVAIDNLRLFEAVNLSASFLPARLTGVLDTALARPEAELAIALNGRVVALTTPVGSERRRFSAMLPEVAFRDGANTVEVYEVHSRRGTVHIARTDVVGD
jgi:hypothetical protein